MKPSTTAIYQPLIDKIPSHPDTIMTALIEAQRLTEIAGQDFTVLTCDQQLYRVALQITWALPERFKNVILRLGGMHLLMSFIGSIGSLRADSGLSELLSGVFAGVPKMLKGKKFPQNMRALRVVAEEVLRGVIFEYQPNANEDLSSYLDTIASKSKTSKLWVDCLLKPVFLMMLYVRAEREGNWLLHIDVVRKMIPHFFAAGHQNYARYGLFYLRTMENMPASVMSHFLNGEHVMRHMPGFWNGIWSDMWIETTFMRFGHSKKGIIGITLEPETLKTWALSLHICTRLEEDLARLSKGDCKQSIKQQRHKEEMESRIEKDKKDREGIRYQLQNYIDPLNPDTHPLNLVNIASGRLCPDNINVHCDVEIGSKQMTEFENGWPTSFYERIPQKVNTMVATRKQVVVNEKNICDTQVIYSRVIGLQASSRNINIEEVLSHELSLVPTALFDDTGEMRISTNKFKLKTILREGPSPATVIPNQSSFVIDGSAMLWVVPWPDKGTVSEYINRFKSNLISKLQFGEVYLVFDRYYDYSTKDAARNKRASGASRVYKLTVQSTLPSQKVILTVTENKKQLINLICKDLENNLSFLEPFPKTNKLIITGQDEVPYEVSGLTSLKRPDLATLHEEADVIIAQQACKLAKEGSTPVTVISDDTDVFLLLIYHYLREKICLPMYMESPVRGRPTVDIKASVQKHGDIIPDILAAHALSGCDTTGCLFGIGKGKVVKVLKQGNSLSLLGDQKANIADVIHQASIFINTCYDYPNCVSTSEARVRAWSTKMGKHNTSQPPKLCSLPPTNEAFEQNVKRAHLQTIIWKNALESPPTLDPEQFGFNKNSVSKLLLPITLPGDIPLAPKYILKLVRCSCDSEKPCHTKRCGCLSSGLPCTLFWECVHNGCFNKYHKVQEED